MTIAQLGEPMGARVKTEKTNGMVGKRLLKFLRKIRDSFRLDKLINRFGERYHLDYSQRETTNLFR